MLLRLFPMLVLYKEPQQGAEKISQAGETSVLKTTTATANTLLQPRLIRYSCVLIYYEF